MNPIDYRPKTRGIRTKETLKNETKRVVKSLIITLSLMIIVLSVAFLAITSQNAQKGYALEQAKLKNEELNTIKAGLNNKIDNSTAVNNIEENEKIRKMNETEIKNYVTPEDNKVK